MGFDDYGLNYDKYKREEMQENEKKAGLAFKYKTVIIWQKKRIENLEKENEELINALIWEIKNQVCLKCNESNICKETCITGKHKQLIEKHKGKKWEEINNGYK